MAGPKKPLTKNEFERLQEKKTIIKGAAERIKTKEAVPLLTGEAHKEKIAKLLSDRHAAKKAASELSEKPVKKAVKKAVSKVASKFGIGLGKKLLRSIPVIGGIASALQTGDASAAIPGLGNSESAGMSKEKENIMMAEIQANKNFANSQAAKDKEAFRSKRKKILSEKIKSKLKE